MTRLLIIILFFTLPFIHGKLLPTLWINYFFNISGNFEFTKAIYFNVFSGVIFLSFLGESLLKYFFHKTPLSILSCQERWNFIFMFLILFFSTLFSTSLFTSVIWDTEKWHTTLMFLNLLWIFIILKNSKKDFLKALIISSLYAGILVSLLAIKEFQFPTYNYGELSTRAIWSFWHPNYLAGYLLLLLPLIFYFHSKALRIIIYSLFITTITLAKSIVALLLAIVYIIMFCFRNYSQRNLHTLLLESYQLYLLSYSFTTSLKSFILFSLAFISGRQLWGLSFLI